MLKKWLIIIVITTLFSLAFLAIAPAQAEGPPVQPPPPTPPAFVPGEILVKFQPHVGMLGAQNSLRAEGVQPLEVTPRSGLFRVQVRPGQEAETITTLMARGDVELATYNHILYASLDPDDPFYGNQWALPKIAAPRAWNSTTGHSNIVVAIVDSGLDTTHAEFSGRIVHPRDEIDNDSIPQDTCSHGTHVAGIIGARGNNAVGVAGVAWDVSLLPVRVLSSSGGACSGTELDVASGIDWAVSHGAKVINLSLGALPWPGRSCEQEFPVMSQAIKEAYQAGVLVVAASGNNYTDRLACPALQAESLAVGATTSADEKASYSNGGTGLNVVAPGSTIYSTLPGGGYGWMSGTSMAAPHVAGLAGLIWSLAPSLTHSQILEAVQTSADDLGPAGWDPSFGYGRINAWRALDVVNMLVSPPQLTLTIEDNSDPVSAGIEITTVNPDTITWSAAISPTVSWLDLPPPAAGTVSASSGPARVTLVATQPFTYGTYTTTVIITGTATSGAVIGPKRSEVQLTYISETYKYHFPILFKN